MGPAPMIRMVEISVLLGIKSRGLEIGHKKRARLPRVPQTPALGINLARGWSLDQIPQPRKTLRGPINRHFPAFALRATARHARLSGQSLLSGWLAEPKLRSSEGWRPGLDLNQDIERCTALAWILSATGPRPSWPITPR